MKPSVLEHDRFITQFDGNQLIELDGPRFGALLQIRSHCLFSQVRLCSRGQDFREIFNLIIRHSHAAMRSEGPDFCERLAAVYQRRRANRNLDRAERVMSAAGPDHFSGSYIH